MIVVWSQDCPFALKSILNYCSRKELYNISNNIITNKVITYTPFEFNNIVTTCQNMNKNTRDLKNYSTYYIAVTLIIIFSSLYYDIII